MICTGLLLLCLSIATYTDLRERIVYNQTTYTGIGVALLGSTGQWLADHWGYDGFGEGVGFTGFVFLPSSFGGFAACGFIMLTCYVLLPGGVGGGDVKLLAMIGAFLGVYAGLEAMLWTLVLGGCFALLVLVWREGALRLIGKMASYLGTMIRYRTPPALNETDRQALKVELFLAPSALLATLIVRFRWIEWFWY